MIDARYEIKSPIVVYRLPSIIFLPSFFIANSPQKYKKVCNVAHLFVF